MKTKTGFLRGFIVGMLVVIVAFSIYFGIQNVIDVAALNGLPVVAKEYTSIDSKVAEVQSLLDSNYINEMDQSKLIDGAVKGYVDAVGDPYTSYFSKTEYASFMEKMEGSYEGIGVVISYGKDNNEIVVVAPFDGSPGQKAGIMPSDVILKVDEESTVGMTLDKVVEKIKGEKGTKVKMTVYRPKTEETLDLEVTRDVIVVPTIEHKLLENQIGYLKISGFEENTYDQFAEALKDLEAQGEKGLIIDVRNNPGGYLNIVASIADELLGKGLIVYTVDKNGKREDLNSKGDVAFGKPIVLLVNENSASASEILAGAIKDRKAGTLVGTTTFGKGVVQRTFDLPDGSAVKITIAKYYTPNGNYIHGIGIEPDIKVELDELTEEQLKSEERPIMDSQLKKAIEVMNTKIK